MYTASLGNSLDSAEKEQVKQFKSEYFKKRFAVSRSSIRHILTHIPETENIPDIVLNKEKNGRITVKNRPDVFISLSYSGSCIAISVGKRKIGSDIEMVCSVALRKIRSSPLFANLTSGNVKNHNQHLLHVWTLLEAYAKFHDMSLYPLTHDRFFLPDAHFVSYLIDQRFILSLASDARSVKDILLWIDPGCGLEPCGGENTATGSSPHMDGDAYVRT